MLPIQNGLICWLEPERYNGLIWKDKTSNKYTFSTPSIKNVVDDMISFNKQSADYFLNNDINIDWNNATIQFKLKDLVDYGDSAIISLNGFEGLQISTTNALGHNKLRLNKYAGRVEIVKEIDLPNINNFVTCVFSNDFIGISIDDNEMIKKKSAIYDSKIFNKICIGNNPQLSYSPIKGKIGTILIYNRVLTEQEILHNIEYEKNKLSYVNENNLPKIVNKLSNASNIKITGNKYGNRVQTVIDKIVEKADNVTKAINQEVTNDSHTFKVGQGNNINVTSDVQDSFSNLAIKGISYQNLFNSLEIKPSPITAVVGSRFKTVVAETPANQYGNVIIPISELYKFKPNHKYTLFVNITKNTFVNKDGVEAKHRAFCINTYNYAGNMIESSNEGNYSLVFEQGATGIKKCVITTKNFDNPSNPFHNCFELYIGSYYTKPGCELSGEFIIVEGDHINNPNIPRYFEGIVGIGDKSKNLFKKIFTDEIAKCPIAKVFSNGEFILNGTIPQHYMFYVTIPKGTYSTNVIQELGTTLHVFWKNGDSGFDNNKAVTYDVDTELQCYITRGTYDNTLCKYQIEQGTAKTKYEPSYDGHKIEFLSYGKNLFNYKNNSDYIASYSKGYPFDTTEKFANVVSNGRYRDIGNGFWYKTSSSVNNSGLGFYIKCKKNTDYNFNCKVSIGGGSYAIKCQGIYTSEKPVKSIIEGRNFLINLDMQTTNETVSKAFNSQNYDYLFFYLGGAWVSNPTSPAELTFTNIILEENSNFTGYIPYQEDKAQILLDEPLMRLPNGVYDEITKDGKLIRRIKKIIVDSSKEWAVAHNNYSSETNITFRCSIDNMTDGWVIEDNKLCNLLPIKTGDQSAWNGKAEGISNDANKNLFLTLNKTKLKSQDVAGLKAWLNDNPGITVYYELAKPVITNLFESQIRIFENGSLTFNTLVAPESTHYVQLNKSAQIQSAIKESQLLDNKIDNLEKGYDTLMLSTMSILDNLELNYILK